jgi:hypothetical protein
MIGFWVGRQLPNVRNVAIGWAAGVALSTFLVIVTVAVDQL